jgi:hypothetical protein
VNRSGRSAEPCTESTQVYGAGGAVNRSGRSAEPCTESTQVYGAGGAVNRSGVCAASNIGVTTGRKLESRGRIGCLLSL